MMSFHCGLQSEEAHARPWQEVAYALETSIENGLTDVEANRRLQECGYNRLRSAKSRSALVIFIDQFKSILVVLLAIAAILSFVFGEFIEGASIAGVILINAGIGFFIELRAVRSMEALERLSKTRSKVVRSGKVQVIADENIAPGDVILLEGGDIVPADLRLFEASKLQADESVLGAFGLAFEWLEENREVAVTISFLTLAFAQLWHVFNMRTAGSNFFKNEIIRNPYIWGALALCILLLAGAVYLPGLAAVLKVTDPGWQGWLLVIGMSLLPWAAGQIINSTGLQSRIIQRR